MVKGITHILTNNATIQGLVGRNAADDKYKVYPVICPHPEKHPYIVVRSSGKVPFGQGKCADTTFTYSFEVHSFHKNYEDAEVLDNAVISALNLRDGGVFNGVEFAEIRPGTLGADGDYVSEYEGLFHKVSTFEAEVNEG